MMKRILAILLVLLFGAGTAPAFADVTVLVNIFKDKDKVITEEITKDIDVVLNLRVRLQLDSAAKAQAIVNQLNEENVVLQRFRGPGAPVDGFDLLAITIDSIRGNQGVTAVNQDVGNNANQAFEISGAVTDVTNGPEGGGVADAEAEVDQVNQFNSVTTVRNSLDVGEEVRAVFTANLQSSIANNSGVVSFNQNAGNVNNQANVVAVAVGIGDENHNVALSEAALGQVNTHPEPEFGIEEERVNKTSTINASIVNNSGIVGVNQTSGNMANQANVVAVSASFDQLFRPIAAP